MNSRIVPVAAEARNIYTGLISRHQTSGISDFLARLFALRNFWIKSGLSHFKPSFTSSHILQKRPEPYHLDPEKVVCRF